MTDANSQRVHDAQVAAHDAEAKLSKFDRHATIATLAALVVIIAGLVALGAVTISAQSSTNARLLTETQDTQRAVAILERDSSPAQQQALHRLIVCLELNSDRNTAILAGHAAPALPKDCPQP